MIDKIKKMPKIELHLHFDGSISPSIIAKLTNSDILEIKDKMIAQDKCNDLSEYLTKFAFPLSLMQTKDNLITFSKDLVNRLSLQNIIYAEIRFAPMFHTKSGLTYEEVIDAILLGLQTNSKIKTNLILCMMRGFSKEDNLKTIEVAEKYLGKGVCALDLAGDEAKYPLDDYLELFEIAKQKGIPFTIHAGENTNANEVKKAIMIGASRIGHGIRAIEKKEVLDLIKEKNILLEICPTSNIQTNAIDKYANHPIKNLIRENILVSLNTDNETVSNISLNEEYIKTYNYFQFNLNDYYKMNINAINASFLEHSEKEALIKQIKAFYLKKERKEVSMKKKDLISVSIIIFVILLLLSGIVYFNFFGNNEISDTNDKEDKMIFQKISAIENYKPNLLEIYDNKYIIIMNKLYDLGGNMIFDGTKYDRLRYDNGYIIAVKDNKYGLLGKDYKVLIPFEYQFIGMASERCFFLRTGIENSSNIKIYNPKTKKEYGPFKRAKYYNDNLIIVEKDVDNTYNGIGNDNVSNKLVKYVLDIQNNKLEKIPNSENYGFGNVDFFQDKYFIVSKLVSDNGVRKVLLDKKGNEVLKNGYDDIQNIDDKFLLVKLEDTYKLITIDNQIILTSELINYSKVYMNENIIVIEKEDNTVNYYDLNGNLIYNTSFKSVNLNYIKDNKYIISDTNKCLYIDLTNNVNKKDIDYGYCEESIRNNDKGYIVKKDEKDTYLYDNNLNQVFKNAYDDIILNNKYCIVKKDDQYKILSYNEELLIEQSFTNYWLHNDNDVILSDDNDNTYYFKY